MKAQAKERAYAEAMRQGGRSRAADLAPTIAAEFFAFAPFENMPVAYTERKLSDRLRPLGAQHFRMTVIARLFTCPAYALGIYVEGWRKDPARMDPPHREGPFNFPLTAPRVPFQSDRVDRETQAHELRIAALRIGKRYT